MRFFLIFLIALLALALQSTLFENLTIMGAKPDLLLIIVVFSGFIKGRTYGGVLGFMLGLLEDLVTGRFIGLNALTKGTIGYLIGLVEGKVYKENLLAPGILLVIASLTTGALNVMLLSLVGVELIFSEAFRNVIIPMTIYNVGLAPLFYLKYYQSITSGVLSGRN